MTSTLIIGIIIFFGFLFGELAEKIKLPKVTGYIFAGLLLNPSIFHIVPRHFINNTNVITNISLSFITFSVGGTLFYPKLKKLGKGILYITFFEAEFAFLAVAAGFLLISPLFIQGGNSPWLMTYIPISILIASLASPTDPSATLAVIHEYDASGEVSSTIMGVAAFDDVMGIVNYSIAVTFARFFVNHSAFNLLDTIYEPSKTIFGAIILGIISGFVLNKITKIIRRETEGALIVVILSFLLLCFGAAKILKFDELLATMAMGAFVVNYNPAREKIFKMLERYTDELIFTLFFTISSMHLELSVLFPSLILVLFFILFRALGKFSGVITGSVLSKASSNIRKYTTGGLIPQGGIVIGLALMIQQNPTFDHISKLIINLIIGATIIHEFIGPIISKATIKKAGEIKT